MANVSVVDPYPDLGRIKGAALREFVGWCATELGRERFIASALTIAPHVRQQLDLDFDRESLGILSSSWYPAAAIHELLEAIFAGVEPRRRVAMIEQAAEAVMRRTLRGVYRVLFEWLATPGRYAVFADRLWRSYYDRGDMNVVIAPAGRAVSTVRAWRSHHPIICELNRAAASAIYRAMGCTDVVTVRTSCVDDGAPECRFVTTWSVHDA